MTVEPNDLVSWDAPPPLRDAGWIPVLMPWRNQPITAQILSPRAERVFTHWDAINKRSLPHFEGPGVICQGCAITHFKRWNGYLAGFLPVPGRLVLIHLTAEAVRGCPQLLNREVSLRGAELRLQRTGNSPTSSVRAFILGYHPNPNELPPAFDVRARLMKLWGACNREEMERQTLVASDRGSEPIPVDFGLREGGEA